MSSAAPGAEPVSRETKNALFEAAVAVAGRAYAPYSGYRVGVAILGDDGAIHVGCNVENTSFGLTVCAERNALAAMVAAGCRSPRAILVVTRDAAMSCGACRQAMVEFNPSLPVLFADFQGIRAETNAASLLPGHFLLKNEIAGDKHEPREWKP